jgi:predicted nucleotidyltransferase
MIKGRAEALAKIKRFMGLLESKMELEKIILFGSHNQGRQKRWSDIDLAVISKRFESMDYHDRLVFLGLLAWQAETTEIEALGYTLDEYKNATQMDFLGEIKRTGKIIYEKS